MVKDRKQIKTKNSRYKVNKKVLITFVLMLVIIFGGLILFTYKRQVIDSAKIYNFDEETIDENLEEIVKEETLDLIPVSYDASVPIFMYHWIRDDVGYYPYPENMVKPDELRKQMNYLKDDGYDVIFVKDLKYVYKYNKPVILTFDDGWMDVYTVAFQIAKELNMKISMYVITNLVGTPGYCTIEQLREMNESGLVEIESHTLSHPHLSSLTFDNEKSELIDSKKYLKDNLNINSKIICYPYGDYNNRTIENSKEAGYEYGLAMDGGIYYTNKHKDIYKIPRIYATRSMTINTFVNYCEKSNVDVVW